MPFIGNKPSAVPLTSADITDGIITSAKIVDGTIVNADINASAAIVGTKLSGVNDAKAWVNFNGTGTPAIREDFNVTSITDNGTGDYTINFTTAFADANYCAVGMAGSTSGGESGTMIVVSTKKNTSQATGNVRVSTMYTDSDNTDVSNIGVAIFR